jgi:hypothetical protein
MPRVKSTAKKAASKKDAAKKAAPKKVAAKKAATRKIATKKGAPTKVAPKKAALKKAASKGAAAKDTAPSRWASRADLGAPIDGFFAKHPAALRAVLDELRKLIEAAAPDAVSSIKWGIPVFTLGGAMMCALGGHKTHVNLILSGPPDGFDDPDGHLEGSAATGRHMKLRSVDEIPRADVRRWLRTASETARAKK